MEMVFGFLGKNEANTQVSAIFVAQIPEIFQEHQIRKPAEKRRERRLEKHRYQRLD